MDLHAPKRDRGGVLPTLAPSEALRKLRRWQPRLERYGGGS
jgi:hypothetical protein